MALSLKQHKACPGLCPGMLPLQREKSMHSARQKKQKTENSLYGWGKGKDKSLYMKVFHGGAPFAWAMNESLFNTCLMGVDGVAILI